MFGFRATMKKRLERRTGQTARDFHGLVRPTVASKAENGGVRNDLWSKSIRKQIITYIHIENK